jgi:hypothetical protein
MRHHLFAIACLALLALFAFLLLFYPMIFVIVCVLLLGIIVPALLYNIFLNLAKEIMD